MKNIRKLIFTLFFISGISGLMYEVVWVRMYSRIIGSTNYAISIVLAAFMGGLALGSLLFGKIIDKRKNKLLFFAILELGIGIIALLVTVTLPIFGPFYKHIYTMSGGAAGIAFFIRASLLFVYILIPATLMGGTLPVLISYLTDKFKTFGKDLSLLYGINTLGAVLGVVLSGYFTLGFFGERVTVIIGVMLNLIVAGIVLLIPSKEKNHALNNESHTRLSEEIQTYPENIRKIILVSIFLSGMTALAYEVIWSRQLILYLKTSIYAFSAMLATFLSGIGIGSMFITWKIKKIKNPLFIFGILEILIGIMSIINIYSFILIDNSLLLKLFGKTFAAIIIVFPLTFLFGAVFPVATLAFTKNSRKSGSSVGTLYGFNTIGNILGSILGGFILIPVIGSSNSIIILGFSNLIVGILLVFLDTRKAFAFRLKFAAAIPLTLLLSFGFIGTDPFIDLIAKRISLLAEKEGTSFSIYTNQESVQGTVTSFSIGDKKLLWINGVGMTVLCTDTKMMAHIPVALSPDPKEMLIIAFGMGTTPRSASLYKKLNVTAVEIVPEVYKCFPFYYTDAKEVVQRNNLKLVVDDGRNYLFLTNKKFDIITMDPSPPIWSSGTVNLYSKEFFELCKDHLTPHGIMCLWFPGDATEDEIKAVLRSFHSVFPHTQVWSGVRGWGFYFIGMPEGLEIKKEKFDNIFRNPVTHKDIFEFAHFDMFCKNADEILRLFLWDEKEVARHVQDFPLVTDDFPYTEFPMWRHDLDNFESWKPQKQLQYIKTLIYEYNLELEKRNKSSF